MKLLLVDDQRLFVESLKRVIEFEAPDLEVVGIANDGLEAVAMARDLEPDLILLDVRMPNLDGVEAARAILAHRPATFILMLTTYNDDACVYKALRLGARGFLLKDLSPDRLIEAIRSVQHGAVTLAPAAALAATAGPAGVPPPRPEWFASITEREREILTLLAQSYSNREIGQRLHLGDQTVRNYISEIYSKLGVRGRFEAIRVAIEAGLGRDPRGQGDEKVQM